MTNQPIYMFWALELIYFLFACWVTLSAQYWINYPGLTKRKVLQILKMKLIPLAAVNQDVAGPNGLLAEDVGRNAQLNNVENFAQEPVHDRSD